MTCGAVKALAAMAAAVCLRTPRIAIRSSRGKDASRIAATCPGPGSGAGAADCAPASRAWVTAAAAA